MSKNAEAPKQEPTTDPRRVTTDIPQQLASPLRSSVEHRIAFSIAEICQLVGVSRSWLYAEWQAGRGPARIKLGASTRITRKALETWLAELGGENP